MSSLAENFIDDVEQLTRLHRSGVLTDEEFAAATARLTNGDEHEQLAGLHRSGVLTDEEFAAATARLTNGAAPATGASPAAAPGHEPRSDAEGAELSTAMSARTAASLAELNALLLNAATSQNEPIAPPPPKRITPASTGAIAPPTPKRIRPTSARAIAVVVGLVAVAAVALLVVALQSGDDDGGGGGGGGGGDVPPTTQAAAAPSDVDPMGELLAVGGVIHVAPDDLPGDGWTSGTLDRSSLPPCEALGTVDTDRIQLVVNSESGLALSIAPTSGAISGADFGADLAECLTTELDDLEPPPLPGALASAMLPSTIWADASVDLAIYVLAGTEDSDWLVSLIGDSDQILAEGEDILTIVESSLP